MEVIIQELDAGIRDLVVALQGVGIPTLASCEGHLDHGVPGPWVDVGDPAARILAKQAFRKEREAEFVRAGGLPHDALATEAAQLLRQARALNLTPQASLLDVLDRFYLARQGHADCRLIVNPAEWSGIGRLQCQGTDLQEIRNESERARALACYQREMEAFASFLRSL